MLFPYLKSRASNLYKTTTENFAIKSVFSYVFYKGQIPGQRLWYKVYRET